MRFDWYSATIQDSSERVVNSLMEGLGGQVKRVRGMHGYTSGHEISKDGEILARVQSGGFNGAPNAWASGDLTDAFVSKVRSQWPLDHHVTRMDSAVDFTSAGCWDKLSTEALNVADQENLRVGMAGDFHRGVEGRTLYIGSRKSQTFVRLYEKGRQVLDASPDLLGKVSADWVRLEAVVRPVEAGRHRAAVCTPSEAWGFSRTTRVVSQRLLKISPPVFNMREHRRSDDEKALNQMVLQYGRILNRIALKQEKQWCGLGEVMRAMHYKNETEKLGLK